MAAEKVEEGSTTLFNKNRLLSKTRIQESACDICPQRLIQSIGLISTSVLPSPLAGA